MTMNKEYAYTAVPTHDVEFMHELRTQKWIGEGVTDGIDYDLLQEVTKEFHHQVSSVTGEEFPVTIVFPEVRWKVTRELRNNERNI